MTVLAVCAWEPQCVTLMTKVSVNASPAQSALSLSSHLLSAAVLVRTHSLTVCCHIFISISSPTTGLDFSVFTRRGHVSLRVLAIGHSLHTPLNEPLKKTKTRCLALSRSWNQIPEAVRCFFFQEGSTHSNLRIT